ncbi:type II toxin-antitoxin system RelE/ParE family toxin [Chryseobacterium gambrini]|uniref:type II toxin-antitoxin system RelE/ParE family toxin n=1 Tax=Chryseobacterium gambrini TaxID=373672 RepID=UPI0022F40744|nr:type II toxin-antitoxin system RelE/ParE family toxin [Chryseobacterium gambrini]WBX97000.1 type II toxin-antitoxin system RelE/ParE family toxin [Chryseobacterium gambrini]
MISDEAKLDVEHSYLYYKSKVNKKIADQFFKDFEYSLKIISKNPFFKIWFENFRAKPMKKYPFLIFYMVNTADYIIIISRVFHTSQNPEKYPHFE